MPAQQQSHHDPPDDNNTYDHGSVPSRRGSAAPRNKNVYTYTQDGMHRLATLLSLLSRLCSRNPNKQVSCDLVN